MPDPDSLTFLHQLDKRLWNAADKSRSNLDAAIYKMLKDPENDFFVYRDGYHTPAQYEEAIDLIATTPFQHADLRAA